MGVYGHRKFLTRVWYFFWLQWHGPLKRRVLMYHPINLTATSHAMDTHGSPESRRLCPVLKHHSFNDTCRRATRWTPPGLVTGSQQNTERLMKMMKTMLKPLIQQTHSWNLRIIQFLKGHFEIGRVFRGFIVSCRWNSQLFWWFFGRFSYWELRHGMRHDQVISWICFLSVFWYKSCVFLCFLLYIIILPFYHGIHTS